MMRLRFFLHGVLALACLSPMAAQDTVTIVAAKPNAYESNTASGYGEVQLLRNGTSGALTVYLAITSTAGFTTAVGTYAFTDYIEDCDLRVVLPVGSTNPGDLSTLPNGAALPDRSVTQRLPILPNGHFPVVFPDGQNSVRIRLYAWREASDLLNPELAEKVTFVLDPDEPNSAPVLYNIGAQQATEVTIVDGNITLGTRVDDGNAEELDLPVNYQYVEPRILGNIRLWFENGTRRNAALTSSYAPHAERYVELSKSGNGAGYVSVGTDADVFGTIGGGLCSERGNDDVQIANPYALRLVDEYSGNPSVPHVTAFNTIPTTGSLPNVSASVQVVVTGITQQNPTIPAATFTAGPGIVTLTATTGASATGLQVTRVAGNELTVAGPGIGVNIREGAVINMQVLTITQTVAGTPPVVVVTSAITGAQATVHNGVMYPAGTMALGFANTDPVKPASLYVGDQIKIGGSYYRIIGPTPMYPSFFGHPSGSDSLQDSQLLFGLENNLSGVTPIEAGYTWLIVYPPLQAAIARDGDLSATTVFPLTFPAANSQKEVVHMAPMPYFPDADGYGHPTYFPAELPYGDWIDVMLQARADFTVEGAEAFTITANTTTANNGYDVLTPQSGTIWVADNDATAVISRIQDAIEPSAAGVSGDPALFLVTVSAAFPKEIQIPYTILNDGSTTATPPTTLASGDFTIPGYDVVAQRGVVTLPAGALTAVIRVDPAFNGVPNVPALSMGLQLTSSLDYRLLGEQGGRNNSVATATIIDNVVQGPVTLSLDTAAVAGGNGREHSTTPVPLRYRVSFPANVTADTNVYFAIGAASTATSSLDYVVPSTAYVTVLTGTHEAFLSIDVLDDQVVEPAETVVVSLLSGAGYILSAQTQVSGQILDDEPIVSITTSVATTAEPSVAVPAPGTVVPGQFIVSYPGIPIGVALNRPIDVPYTVTGSATIDQDYSGLTGSITIPANQLSVTIDITPRFDNVLEGGETVNVTLVDNGGAGAGTYDVDSANASLTINDNTSSLGMASVSAPDGGAAESDTVANGGTVLVSLNRWQPLILTGSYVGGETQIQLASSSGQPISLPAGTTIWLPGATAAAGDDIAVTVATLTVVSSSTSVALSVALPVGTYLTGTCYATNGLADGVGIDYTAGGTATASVDYIPLSGNLSFDVLALSGGPYAAGDTTLMLATSSGATIVLPAGAILRLPGTAPSPADDVTTTVSATTVINGTARSVSVSSLSAVSTAGAAFTMSQPVSITVIDDQLVEPSETVVVSLLSGAHYAVNSSAKTGTVTIHDDEPVVSVFALDPVASEPSTSNGVANKGQFVFSYSGLPLGTALQRDVTITYTLSGTSTDGVDYTSLSGSVALTGTVTIPAGVLSTVLDVVPLYDTIADSNETVILTITDVGGPVAGAYDVAGSSATVTIADVAPNLPVASLTADDLAASESDGSTPEDGRIMVNLTRPTGSDEVITVSYNLGGTANLGVDYMAPASLSFRSLTLSGGPYAVTGATTLTLASRDGSFFGLPVGSRLALPNGTTATVVDDPATLIVESYYQIGSAAASIPVNLAGPTIAGTVYIVSQPLDITVLDDQVAEGPETVVVTLSTSAAYSIVAPSTQTVTIADDEPVLWVVATTPAAMEPPGASNGVFTIGYTRNLPGSTALPERTPLARPVTISYLISGTATAGVDYSSLTGTVTIAAEAISTTISVVPLADVVVDAGETVILTLVDDGGPLNGTVDVMADASAGAVTINEPPPEITVDLASSVTPAFQAVSAGQTITIDPASTTVTLRIGNTLTGDLILTPLTAGSFSAVSGCAPAAGALASPVLTGNSTDLIITTNAVSPTASWGFTITLRNNDPDEGTFVLTVLAPVAQQIVVSRVIVSPTPTIIATDTNGTVSLVPVLDPAADVVTDSAVSLVSLLSYKVANLGVGNMTINSVSVSDQTNCVVTIPASGLGAAVGATTIASNAFDTLPVSITPSSTAAGAGWWCRVLIATSDNGNLPAAGGYAAGTFVLTISSQDVVGLPPEIAVSANGVAIANGQSNVAGGDVMAQGTATLTYTAANLGLGTLHITGAATISSAANCAARVVAAPAAAILSGASSPLRIEVTPLAVGTWTFTVSLPNDDANESPTSWTVVGYATPLSVEPSDLGLGGSGGGCGAGAGGALGLLALATLALAGGRRRRQPGECGE